MNQSAKQFRKWEAEYADDPDYITHGLLYEAADDICRALVREGIDPEAITTELSARMGLSKWRARRFLNTPTNTTVLEIVRYAQAVGLKVEITLTPNGEE